jgi:hypothetical protein
LPRDGASTFGDFSVLMEELSLSLAVLTRFLHATGIHFARERF